MRRSSPPVVEGTENQSEEDKTRHDHSKPRRGRGRSEIIRMGQRGRPTKRYNMENSANFVEEESFIAEIPLHKAMRGTDSKE